jgi:hypothetical protein
MLPSKKNFTGTKLLEALTLQKHFVVRLITVREYDYSNSRAYATLIAVLIVAASS